MAELPLAAGLLDLRPGKLSPKPPPPLPPRRRTHATAAAAAVPSPRRAVPERHSTTELADGSIVFRFGPPKPDVLEPQAEPASRSLGAAAATRPDSTVSPASGAVSGGETELKPDSEQGVTSAGLDAPAAVEQSRPNAAAVVSLAPPPASAGAASAADKEEPEQSAGSNAGVEEAEARQASVEAIAAAESEYEPEGDGAGVRTSGAAVETTWTGLEPREGSEDASAADASGGCEEATGTAGLKDSEAAPEGSTAHDFNTDVETESSGSSGDEQGAEFGPPLPAEVCNRALKLIFRIQMTRLVAYHELLLCFTNTFPKLNEGVSPCTVLRNYRKWSIAD